MASPVHRFLPHLVGRLRFPYLFALTLVLFVIDLVVPDPIPFLDELLLGLAAACFGSLKRRGAERRP